MSTITINNPTVAVEDPTPFTNPPLSITGSGEVSVVLNAVENDGNVATDFAWDVSNVQNGTFVRTDVGMGSTTQAGATGSVFVPVGQTVRLTFVFNVPAGDPGVTNPDCTADYTAQWV